MHVVQIAQRSAPSGKGPGDEMEEQDPDAVDVALDRRFSVGEELRREVERSPSHPRSCLPGSLGAEPPGAEIHQQDSAAILAHYVLRLDVAMKESRAMHRRERAADAQPDQGRL